MGDADIRVETAANGDVQESSSSGSPSAGLWLFETWTGNSFPMTSHPVRFRKEDWP
jgi:hypothetical protein